MIDKRKKTGREVMPEPKEHNQDTRVMLMQLRTKLEAVEDRMERENKQLRDDIHNLAEKKEKEFSSVYDQLQVLNQYRIEATTGRRILIALLAAAGAFGAFLWEIIQKIFVVK